MREIVLKYVLQNAIFYSGKADSGAVLGKVMAGEPALRKKVQEVRKEIEQAVKQINSISPEQQKVWLETLAPELLKKPSKSQEGLPDLPGARTGRVVTRFAPSPTGPLNISHVLRAVMINYLYAKKYRGKFILRFEDTDSSKVSKEYYDMIKEDLKSIGVKPGLTVIQSCRMERYYLFAARLIRKRRIFACFCSAEKFREFSKKKRPCPDERATAQKNLKVWKDALAGKHKEGEVVFRFRTSMREPNPALRNPAVFRISEEKHPLQGKKYMVWPLYNYANVIDDHELGVTHVFRGKEHEHNTAIQKKIYDALGWKTPTVLNFGMIYLPGEKLHTRDIKEWIAQKKVSGWDDPKLHTVRALVRRGFLPDMFRQLAENTGLSKNDIRLGWENIEGINRKIIDPLANRYMVVKEPVRISVRSSPRIKVVEEPLHPDFPERGKKKIPVNLESIWISGEDFSNLDDRVFRLKGLGNIHLKGKEGYYTGNEIVRDMQKIQWVSEPNVTVRIVTPEKIIKGIGEPNLAKLKPGTLIQMERVGFGRMDKVENGLVTIFFAHK
ncbi:MAG: glutamate--tRNA ligase [Candidatus Aenigmarchaeota archaeon]|nr:glutamate--tRNA ligase [Candidatus Aenigmarchaeota archaeon]